jgi:prepilin-type N-terminal cleavage/methylation domain-containing protein
MALPNLKRIRHNGYSLIELLIVVGLIAILTAIAGLSFRRYQKSIQADSIGSDLAQKIREIRARAMADRTTYQIALVRDSGAPSDAYVIGRFPNNPTFPPQVVRLPTGWRFLPFTGTPTPPATVLRLAEGTYAIPPLTPPTILNDSQVNLTGRNTTFLTFKGDGSVVQFNNVDPTSNFNNTPLNRVYYFYDANEGDATWRYQKVRAVTVFGLTGQTQLWKLVLNGSTAQWASGAQKTSN